MPLLFKAADQSIRYSIQHMSYLLHFWSAGHNFFRVQARLEQQLKNKLLTLLAQKGSMTQEVSVVDLDIL